MFGLVTLFMTFAQRKSDSQKKNPPKPRNPQKIAENADLPVELDEPSPSGDEEDRIMQQRPKRLKRPTKSVNENLEPVISSTANMPTTNSAKVSAVII